MVKKTFLVLITIVLMIGTFLIAFFKSNYYYSKELVSAIKEENILAVQQIIERKPTCINTVPACMPKGFYVFTDIPRPIYPFGEACYSSNIEMIQFLIESGAEINGIEQVIPLSIIYRNKNDNWYEISQLLLQNGASLDYITDYSGGKSSVLQDIVQVRSGAALPGYKPESKEDAIKAFHYALEKCDHNNVNWMRVLQHSVSNNRIEIVKLLLEQEYCTVNDTSVGITALMFAARDSTPEMVQFLLDYGADKNIKSTDGKTAYDYAVQFNNKDIIALLEN